MSKIAYMVTARLPDEPARQRYLQWLLAGHVQAVAAAGAEIAEVVHIDDPLLPPTVISRYVFPDQATYLAYLQSVAPTLRADGIARFGNSVTFSRCTGTILPQEPDVPPQSHTTQPLPEPSP